MADPAQLHKRLELIAWQKGKAVAFTVTDVSAWVEAARVYAPHEGEAAFAVDDLPEAIEQPQLPSGPPASAYGQAPAVGAVEPWQPPGARTAGSMSGVVPSLDAVPTAIPVPANEWRKTERTQFLSFDEYEEGKSSVRPLSRESLHAEDAAGAPASEAAEEESEEAPKTRRMDRIRSKGEELSRWVVRGVVHPTPWKVVFGSIISLLWRLSLMAAIVATVYLLAFQDENLQTFKVWIYSCGGALVLLGLMNLHYATSCRCRICSCHLFHSRNCLKNRKAHHILLLGYVGSLALHVLLFRWFRCMYCGTAIRLRKAANK